MGGLPACPQCLSCEGLSFRNQRLWVFQLGPLVEEHTRLYRGEKLLGTLDTKDQASFVPCWDPPCPGTAPPQSLAPTPPGVRARSAPRSSGLPSNMGSPPVTCHSGSCCHPSQSTAPAWHSDNGPHPLRAGDRADRSPGAWPVPSSAGPPPGASTPGRPRARQGRCGLVPLAPSAKLECIIGAENRKPLAHSNVHPEFELKNPHLCGGQEAQRGGPTAPGFEVQPPTHGPTGPAPPTPAGPQGVPCEVRWGPEIPVVHAVCAVALPPG